VHILVVVSSSGKSTTSNCSDDEHTGWKKFRKNVEEKKYPQVCLKWVNLTSLHLIPSTRRLQSEYPVYIIDAPLKMPTDGSWIKGYY
jgi:hypothetical protein